MSDSEKPAGYFSTFSILDPNGSTFEGAFYPAYVPSLMVANAGGHVAELLALAPAFDPFGTARWVTNDTSQTRSLLSDRPVRWAPYSSPRDVRSAARHLALATRSLRDVDHVVSTGSSLAPPFLLALCMGSSVGPS